MKEHLELLFNKLIVTESPFKDHDWDIVCYYKDQIKIPRQRAKTPLVMIAAKKITHNAIDCVAFGLAIRYKYGTTNADGVIDFGKKDTFSPIVMRELNDDDNEVFVIAESGIKQWIAVPLNSIKSPNEKLKTFFNTLQHQFIYLQPNYTNAIKYTIGATDMRDVLTTSLKKHGYEPAYNSDTIYHNSDKSVDILLANQYEHLDNYSSIIPDISKSIYVATYITDVANQDFDQLQQVVSLYQNYLKTKRDLREKLLADNIKRNP